MGSMDTCIYLGTREEDSRNAPSARVQSRATDSAAVRYHAVRTDWQSYREYYRPGYGLLLNVSPRPSPDYLVSKRMRKALKPFTSLKPWATPGGT